MVEYNPRNQIHKRSLELFEEFEQHYQEFIKAYPDRTDRHIVFESWAIQKIADLQLTVFKKDLFSSSDDFECQRCAVNIGDIVYPEFGGEKNTSKDRKGNR